MDDVMRPEVRHSTCFQYVFVQFRALRLGQTTLMRHIDLIILSEAGLNNIDRIVRCQARLAKKIMLTKFAGEARCLLYITAFNCMYTQRSSNNFQRSRKRVPRMLA